ncbi:ent-kaurenoic acid oxidase 1-like [Lolium rigidum]|uniref:ent-kaurenoic acid oxidase 1-like n=1 Tax=Lolium rigidum TaxID=89674 RepID=UPI001F5C942E|nr:ent-kaurenoic acid oxidase 1-like [Lolium rigidum]
MVVSWAYLLGAVPLLCLAFWHAADAWYRAIFFLKHGSKKDSNGVRRRLPPGHMGLPFLGETISLLWYFKRLRRPDEFIRAKRRAYGGEEVGMYRTHLFGSPTVVVCAPAANKFVFQAGGDTFGVRWPVPELVGLKAIGIVEGGHHTRLRGVIVGAINRPSSLRTIATVVQPSIVAAFNSWAGMGTIVASDEAKKVVFTSICKMFVSMEPSPLTVKINQWFTGLLAGLRALPLDFPGTVVHEALKCRRKLNTVFREEIEARKCMSKKHDDVMSGFMETEDEQGMKLSDDEVVDNILSAIAAGYESTATAIMWAMYHLAKSPVALAKLREENVAMSKTKGSSYFITHDDIPKMKYTTKVVEETIRMANIASMMPRVAKRDVEYGGYTIPEGWQVMVMVRSLHTDPNYYPDPLTFNPDRWSEPAKPGTYQVFGGGYRICPGNMLAKLQLTIMLHHLSIGYEWKLLNPNAEINYLPHPKPVDGAAMAFRRLATK